MQYAATQQATKARRIARSAQKRIKERTGMDISLILCSSGGLRSPEGMLGIIARALNMAPDSFKARTRARPFAELRFIAAHILRQYFPKVTLQQIAALFGGLDHTSVISGLARANNLIYTGDEQFTTKYHSAQKAVDLWLRHAE
jgi:chromosomal replication initiation ATPase DnaA